MITEYEKKFNEKIDFFKNHKDYLKVRKQADKALSLHTGTGLDCIIARDFMDRIIEADISYIKDWFNEKNNLEWEGIRRK